MNIARDGRRNGCIVIQLFNIATVLHENCLQFSSFLNKDVIKAKLSEF